MSAIEIAARVRSGEISAVAVAREAIATIRAKNDAINAVTRILEDRALAEARAVDDIVAAGRDPGPLAGVPYGVKDLFDVAGLPTTAGAGMRRNAAPAVADAEAISRLRAAGAVLVATLNMDEFAYGFVTVNAAFGTTRNPRDVSRLAGGSSGGSAAAVAAGMLPLALGSDTNGSIRVPAALCGIYGLRPTQDALPTQGTFPFVESFDTIGPFATSIADLDAAWRALGGVGQPHGSPRVARLSGWFDRTLSHDAARLLDSQFAGLERVEWADVERARSAAFLMTAREGGLRHLPELRTRALEFDPATRDRLIAGALLPETAYRAAQAFRAEFRACILPLFDRQDVLVAPCIGEGAPLIDDPFLTFGGERVPARANLGLLAQPISFIGLPVIAAPLRHAGPLPLGIQLIGRPGGEADLFTYATGLEAQGIIGCATAA
ncbi:AtzE family amidohydrolase [Sphingomonas sp. MMS24-J13]|uniref:AtzE family amidohydrolase n=1 Tax=Sphingomonas sp. MMS24-J13 TaxID=3238686 RepID=UPI00385063F8